MYFCEFDPPNFSSARRKLIAQTLLKRSCTKFSNARTVLIKYQLLKYSFFISSSKVKMLALTKSENGYARMLASARTYPISVATLYVPCESVSIQKLLKVDLTRADAF